MLYTPSSPDATFFDLQRHQEELLQEQEELRNTREELHRVQQDLQRARLALVQVAAHPGRDPDAASSGGSAAASEQEIARKQAHVAALQRRLGTSAQNILRIRQQLETASGKPAPSPPVIGPALPAEARPQALVVPEKAVRQTAPAAAGDERSRLRRRPAPSPATQRALLALALLAPFVLMYFFYVFEVARVNH